MDEGAWPTTSHLLTIAAKLINEQAEGHLASLGLSRLGVHALEVLAERDSLIQSDLARELRVRRQTIGVVVAQLERRTWITRKPGGIRNSVAVSITRQGRLVLAKALQAAPVPGLASADSLRPFLLVIITELGET